VFGRQIVLKERIRLRRRRAVPGYPHRSRTDRVHCVTAQSGAPTVLRSAAAFRTRRHRSHCPGSIPLILLPHFTPPIDFSPDFRNPASAGRSKKSSGGNRLTFRQVSCSADARVGPLALASIGSDGAVARATPRDLIRSARPTRSSLCICGCAVDGPNIRSVPSRPMPHHDPCHDYARSNDIHHMEMRIEPVPDSDAAIVLRFEPAVRRFCRSRTRSTADADDAVQDTFLRFLRRSEQKIRSNEAWLITAASRACVDINRRHQRDERHVSDIGGGDVTYASDEDARFSDKGANDPATLTAEHLTVTALMRGLTERDRLILTHLYLLGASSKQVARYLGVTENNVRQIALRARRHARMLLGEGESENATPASA
jgi:RNA polymerase sigma factor (sigma-70 family)